jgi:hypothetical protein
MLIVLAFARCRGSFEMERRNARTTYYARRAEEAKRFK